MADGNNRLFRQPRAVIDEVKAVNLYLQAQGGLQSRECRHRVIDCARKQSGAMRWRWTDLIEDFGDPVQDGFDRAVGGQL